MSDAQERPPTGADRQESGWNRLRYSAYAPFYDLLTAPLRAGRRRAIELLGLRPGERVLIIGCGTGLDLDVLRPDVRVTAFDLTPAMVRRAAPPNGLRSSAAGPISR